MLKDTEYIICAAIHYEEEEKPTHSPKNIAKGVVIGGRRHCDIIGTYHALTGKTTKGDTEQGFLTSHNRFVGREEAAEIAIKAGQVEAENIGKHLFSEDLY